MSHYSYNTYCKQLQLYAAKTYEDSLKSTNPKHAAYYQEFAATLYKQARIMVAYRVEGYPISFKPITK